MATLVIKIKAGVPHFRQRNTLDGVEYTLDFRWSQTEERWYLDLRDSAGTLLVGCIKLVANYPLLRGRRRSVAGLPPGELWIADGREFPADPGLDELGDTHQLLYIDASDLAQIAEAA